MKKIQLAAMVAAASLTLGGCGMLSGGVYDTPLPGGADVGSDPLKITTDFDDVLDLVPQSSVKVDNISVGRVESIKLNPDGKSARVELVVNRSVNLPAGTSARIQQTSLLGEKYVGLVRPETPVAGAAIKSGDKLPLDQTSQSAEVEQVLGALSMVLNGGGVGQFQEISREIQQISDGRPDSIKRSLREMNQFVSGLDDRKESITEALDGLNRLGKSLDADKAKIASALDGLSPGMQVIVDQRTQLVDMLESLDKLSSVTVDTLNASQDDIVADLKALEPILTQLAKAGQDLPKSLEILLTYPFPDSALKAIKGDYFNVFIETNFRTLPRGCNQMGCAWPQLSNPDYYMPPEAGPTDAGADAESADVAPTLLPPTDSAVPGIPSPTVPVPSEPTPDESTPTPSPTQPEPSASAGQPSTGPQEGAE